ncbi:MAG: diaminopimelate epimerase [Ignavibacterium sp.]|nr:diaminopimelate epimerase [Ignavibacterium sp.]MDW8374401.1 diaminopimelate epimerase [Ignavibacteriales bacterium]
MEIKFNKLTGAGNDFILIDKKLNKDFTYSPEIIRKLCDRRFGIGADGVIIFYEKSTNSFEMDYFNSDGFRGSLCGNGARCAAWYHYYVNKSSNYLEFFNNDNKYKAEIIDNELIKIFLNSPTNLRSNFVVRTTDKIIEAAFINTGSPHLVIDISNGIRNIFNEELFTIDIKDFPVLELGRELRFHPDFSPEGTNVNFYKQNENEIILRTYERGVENETLACGTGSVATAIISHLNKKIFPPIKIKTWGGDTLIVNFDLEKNSFNNLSLTGPAKNIFSGTIII